MNKIFKIVFNAARGKMMVVNEATSSVQTGKKAAVTVAVVGALAAGSAMAADLSFDLSQSQLLNVAGSSNVQNVGDADSMISFVGSKPASNAITVQSGGTLNVKAKDLQMGTKDALLDGFTASNVMGGTFTVEAGNVNIYSTTNALSVQQQGNYDSNVEVNADDINLYVTAEPAVVLWAAKDNGKKASLKLKANDSVTVTSVQTDAISIWDSGKNENLKLDITATNDVQINGNGSAIKVALTSKDGATNVSVNSDEGSITLDGKGANGLGALDVSAVEGATNVVASLTAKNDVKITSELAHGIKADNGDVTVNANKIEISAATIGVNARNTSQVTLGSSKTKSVSIGVESSADDAYAMGIQVRNPDTLVTVNGEQFTVEVAASGQDATAYGVIAQGKADANKTGAVMGTLDINAQNTNITVTAENGYAAGVVAMAGGKLNVNGNLTVTAEHSILARGNSVININESGKNTVKLDGDIDFAYHSTSGTTTDASVNLNLTNADSYLRGNIYTTENNAPNPDLVKMTGMKFGLDNGATWSSTAASTVNVLKFDADANGVGGVVDLSANAEDVTVDTTISGTGVLLVDVEKSGALVNKGTDNVDLLTITTVQTADDLTAEEAEGLKAKHTSNIEKVEVVVAEGLVQGALVVGADGEVEQAVNMKTLALAEQVNVAPFMITRIMMNDVRKRMGDLRAAEGTHGAWVRYNGGQMSGSGVEADFNMIQVGVDTVPVADAPRFGVAFSYAQTESEDVGGLSSTDMDSFSLAFYGTKMYDNGMFVDVIGRMATTDTEMNVVGNKAKMDNVALSLSGELGWRFDVTDRFFFEPSVEATYTYTNADTFTMGSGKYELEAVDSLVGRAGFAAGFKCPANKGDVYVRAAVVHEFMGDSTMRSWAGDREALPVEMDGKDTWFEYAIGANFNVNKNTYVYADVERTSGGSVDEDWRANVGVRFAF